MIKISLIGTNNENILLSHLILIKNFGKLVFLNPYDYSLKIKKYLYSFLTINKIFFKFKYTKNYLDIKNSNLIIININASIKKGMTEDDLLIINNKIIKDIGENIKIFSPHAFIVCLTQPLPIILELLQKYANIQNNKIIGIDENLDIIKINLFLFNLFKIDVKKINIYSIGGNKKFSIPLLNISNFLGVPLIHIFKKNNIKKISFLLSNFKHKHTIILNVLDAYFLNKDRIINCYIKIKNNFIKSKKFFFIKMPIKFIHNNIKIISKFYITNDQKRILLLFLNYNKKLKKKLRLIK